MEYNRITAMPDDLDDLLDRAQTKTDRQLRGEIAKLTQCSEAELRNIAPADLDPQKLESLIAIVNDATRSNEQKAEAIAAINGLAEIAIGIAAKIAKA